VPPHRWPEASGIVKSAKNATSGFEPPCWISTDDVISHRHYPPATQNSLQKIFPAINRLTGNAQTTTFHTFRSFPGGPRDVFWQIEARVHYSPLGTIQPARQTFPDLNPVGCMEEQKVNGIYYGIPITDKQTNKQTNRQTNTFDPLTP
jgi:hypothetical protein